jgi:hypothetical protein
MKERRESGGEDSESAGGPRGGIGSPQNPGSGPADPTGEVPRAWNAAPLGVARKGAEEAGRRGRRVAEKRALGEYPFDSPPMVGGGFLDVRKAVFRSPGFHS